MPGWALCFQFNCNIVTWFCWRCIVVHEAEPMCRLGSFFRLTKRFPMLIWFQDCHQMASKYALKLLVLLLRLRQSLISWTSGCIYVWHHKTVIIQSLHVMIEIFQHFLFGKYPYFVKSICLTNGISRIFTISLIQIFEERLALQQQVYVVKSGQVEDSECLGKH